MRVGEAVGVGKAAGGGEGSGSRVDSRRDRDSGMGTSGSGVGSGSRVGSRSGEAGDAGRAEGAGRQIEREEAMATGGCSDVGKQLRRGQWEGGGSGSDGQSEWYGRVEREVGEK